ncbi:heparinase II/III domain-containing protein [Gemmatimonas phototrophica]|uniref:Heparinase II/III-like C-terminal domain-containing protein n=1 Tax=Gemmatimonas phototrophica TaxID=1379270 RepID=A0A143BKN3_9BACT|nr:heparinase II/III family protein [Gemmatimonas phototrophica]AMW05145.1 hypothetical protein GEMMAAP_10590 [Gemmatimonas phototrophica]
MGAHLFTAERAVHAAALYLLRGTAAHRDLAVQTLGALAMQYARWPNQDNVLGPTRPFFSTYLESIWLLNLCHALALLEQADERSVSGLVRELVLEPSSALIASYHEGRSNRQVWNEVALLSAMSLLGKDRLIDRRLDGEHSLLGLMSNGLLEDGTWYEGENYHQFAHRGLWYGVQWLTTRGRPLPAALAARFHQGFVTPFAGLLPDETLPSRRDSQYAVSVRQWRWAEWCELGYAASGNTSLAAMLTRLYDGRAPSGASGRAQSTADAERNRDAVALTRADCSWRALLMANAQPAPEARWMPGSVLQPQQGLAVIRRDAARVYVALEGGVSGGGHGHPDRLSLTLQTGEDRWLDDPGTGSYVERTLHWYRSSLAHHAPLINGASQHAGPAITTAFEDRGGAGWIRKTASELAPGVSATRSLIVCDGYLVDLLEWTAASPVTLTLPLASGLVTNVPVWHPTNMPGAGGLEDGFEFLQQTERAVEAPMVVTMEATVTGRRPGDPQPTRAARAWYTTTGTPTWWRGVVPGAPGCTPSTRIALSVEGLTGRIVGVWSWSEHGATDVGAAQVSLNAQTSPVAIVTTSDGTVASHEPALHGWHVGLVARSSRSSIDLEGVLPMGSDLLIAEPRATTRPQHTCAVPLLAHGDAVQREGVMMPLGERSYLATEEPWGGENRPEAQLRLGATAEELVVHVEVATGHAPIVPAATADGAMPENPLDNERADVNADGVQCYLGVAGEAVGQWHQAVLCVPLPTGDVRTTVLVPGGVLPRATCEYGDTGWRLTLYWPRRALPPGPLSFDLAVNERPPHRERRRGQLVLSGGGGFAYLRGDRHAPHAPVALRLP